MRLDDESIKRYNKAFGPAKSLLTKTNGHEDLETLANQLEMEEGPPIFSLDNSRTESGIYGTIKEYHLGFLQENFHLGEKAFKYGWYIVEFLEGVYSRAHAGPFVTSDEATEWMTEWGDDEYHNINSDSGRSDYVMEGQDLEEIKKKSEENGEKLDNLQKMIDDEEEKVSSSYIDYESLGPF